MRKNRKLSKAFLLGLTVAVMVFLGIQGCKDEPAAQTPAAQTHDHDHDNSGEHAHEHASGTEAVVAAANTAAQTAEAKVAAGEQTTCPIMVGNPIDKDLFVEHEGKKVYFCCKGCIAVFQADPAKYIAKLPQFQE